MTRCLCCGMPVDEANAAYHVRCRKQLFRSTRIPVFSYTREQLNTLAASIIQSRISVPGVQPKLSVHLERTSGDESGRLTLVGLDGDFILKPPVSAWPHLPEAEHFCMLFARLCRLSTAEFGLIPLASGELAYITRRMDRKLGGRKIHMEDFCQITNRLTEQKYRGSMEQIGKAIRRHSNVPGLDTIRFFELSVFFFLTGNSDMHLKNFSLIHAGDGLGELSPAYDLVPTNLIMPEDKEEMALSLNGKKARISRSDFEAFGCAIGLMDPQIQKALKRVDAVCKKNLGEALARSFMSDDMKTAFFALFERRCVKLLG